MSLFATDSIADSVFFVESGYVKTIKRSGDGKEVLVSIVGPGQIFGEQAIYLGGPRGMWAEVMQEGVVYEIPRDTFLQFCDSHPEAWRQLAEALVHRQRELEQKISLLCLNDVESRILHYLGSLSSTFGINAVNGQEYALPLSQSELASLIGATRETTSTTLNSLARRGLIRLGRRLLIVHSGDAVRAATRERQPKPAHQAQSA
jgi:CRP/FNR family transcriptional regulator